MTTKHPNNFEILESENKVKIEIMSRGIYYYTFIDLEDWDRVKEYHWHAHIDSKYQKRITAQTHSKISQFNTSFVGLHKFIMNTQDIIYDHKDRNPLNNCKSNLRPATHKQNMYNRSIASNNTSGFKGVYWNKLKQKWRAMIRYEGKLFSLGYFNNKIEAAIAYNNKATELFGIEWANLNVIPE